MSYRTYNKLTTFSSLLETPGSVLGKFYLHAAYLAQLEKKLYFFLESPLNAHCKIANVANDTLLLHSDSAAWAAKLRYNIPAILKYLQTECQLTTLKTIRIKIKLPEEPIQTLPVTGKAFLSHESAHFLNQMAESLPDTDNDLRLSLLKLAKHARSKI